jgi:hypothetical protein
MDVRISVQRSTASAGLFLAACSLLAACGLSSTTGGSQAGDEPTTVVNGTPVQSTRLPNGTSSAGPTKTAAPGGVRLALDKSAYHPGDKVVVTIENGLSTDIVVSDHHTNCGYTVLQQFSGGTWLPIGKCKLLTPTRLVKLAARSVTPQNIGIPSGPSAAGTYRVELTYAAGAGASSAQQGPVYSPTFTVT